MKKLLYSLLIFLFGFSITHAQRDTEHWLAPFYISSSAGTYSMSIYVSTDKTTPFDVTFYNNGTVVKTLTGLSKGNPLKWDLTAAEARQFLYTNTSTELMTPQTRGLRLVAPEKFLCNLRMAQSAHAELLTLKGKSGLGTEFRAVMAPNSPNATGDLYNFTAGILATENNTTVTISEFATGLTLINGPATSQPSYTVTLNAGQSYVLAGNSTGVQKTGFIGAKISANKPITLTNGNANGNFGLLSIAGSDMIMDQSVPTNRLGKTFALVRSLTDIADVADDMEGALIVATEDATQVFLNASTIPVATLNKGQWYRAHDTDYVNQGSGHYNMYISTNKNVYVYQLLGTDGNATGGFNYIPPLGCYLPRVIDEIGNIKEMPNIAATSINLKLNIVTQPGATVSVTSNGQPVPLSGPFNLSGTGEWVTYSVTGISGNVTINSTRAVTAGINGGYSTAGYGGYFAGFSLAPSIEKVSGECIPGLVIGVDGIFESYQWMLNGVDIPGATSNTYTPTQPGNYTLRVLLSGCDYATTDVYKVYPCMQQSVLNVVACGVKTLPVEFSNSSQVVDAASIVITVPPTNGTATINPITKVITYTPNAGYNGPDTFTYTFKSTLPEFGDKETVKVNLDVVQFTLTNATLLSCPYNGLAQYDLTTAAIGAPVNSTVTYHLNLADAQSGSNPIQYPTIYQSGAGTVYARAVTPQGCAQVATITLQHAAQPNLRNGSLTACAIPDNPTSGLFNLTQADVGAGANFRAVYYNTLADAQQDTNPIINPQAYVSVASTVYVRIYNNAGCYNTAAITLNVTPQKYSAMLKDVIICVDQKATLDAGPGFTAYKWSTGATTAAVSNLSVGEYWVDLTSNNCTTRQTVRVLKAPEVVINKVDISENTATVTVSGGKEPYEYSVDGIIWQSSNVIKGLRRGTNTIFVRDAFTCTPVQVTVVVPDLSNAITPNGDGINDKVDFSAFSEKVEPSFIVYDRYGTKIFEGTKANHFIWDGTFLGKKLPTGTYWYTLQWGDPIMKTMMKFDSWILVKNYE